jgi:dipeptidyl aminopeptidase/acylaminoacyl peptidase
MHVVQQFLPDGRHFLFYAGGPADARGIYVGEIDATEAKRLVDAEAAVIYGVPNQLLFVRQGTLFAQPFDLDGLELTGVPTVIAEQVAFDPVDTPGQAVSTDGHDLIAYRQSSGTVERRYTWFDRNGKELQAVGESGSAATLSPDSSRLAFSRRVDGNNDVWVLEIARGMLNRFTSHPALDSHPLWSSDGTRLVFQRFHDGAGDLYVKPVNQPGEEVLLLASKRGKIATDWSHDGAYLLYKEGSASGQGGWDIWALPMTGNGTPFAVVQTAAEERDGQFSPDGKWIAYNADDSGQFEIYAQPFQRSGPRERVSTAGGAQVRWRSDGKELFYLALDGRLMSVPVQIDPDGKTLRPGTPVPLFSPKLVGGVVQPVARQQYIPSPDGERFLMNAITGEARASAVTIISNWKPKS